MSATINDKRTTEQAQELTVGVAGTDRFLSGWGCAAGGSSFAVWACRPDDVNRVESWVRGRGDMSRIRIVDLRDYRPRAAHVSIYPVSAGHPAMPRV